jgi:hypothetical protein
VNAHERRIRSLEKTIPHIREDGFKATVQPVNPPLDDDDPRLKNGVKEFEYVFPPETIEPSRKKKRGRPWIHFAVV